jgi:hypothetical protein
MNQHYELEKYNEVGGEEFFVYLKHSEGNRQKRVHSHEGIIVIHFSCIILLLLAIQFSSTGHPWRQNELINY